MLLYSFRDLWKDWGDSNFLPPQAAGVIGTIELVSLYTLDIVIIKRRMKETLFSRHRNTVEQMMLADDRKATLHAIHTDAINKAVNSQEKNVVFDDQQLRKDITMKERATIAQLRL